MLTSFLSFASIILASFLAPVLLGAVVQNPIIGRAFGKLANTVFSKWKNLNTLRSKPVQVANPDTPAQQMRRGMLSTLVEFGRGFISMLRIGFDGFHFKWTALNAFIRYNYGTLVVAGTPPNFNVDLSAMVISKGPLTVTGSSSVVATDASPTVTVNWPTALVGDDQANGDLAYILVVNEDTDAIARSAGAVARSAGTAAITMPSNSNSGDVVHTYIFFKSASSDAVSDSRHRAVTVA
jgi:hypothetical protein